MASKVIAINHEQAEKHANSIQDVSDDFNKSKLSGIDDKTTLTANKKLDKSYKTSLKLLKGLGNTLATDGENIKKISQEFKKVDEICTNKVAKMVS